MGYLCVYVDDYQVLTISLYINKRPITGYDRMRIWLLPFIQNIFFSIYWFCISHQIEKKNINFPRVKSNNPRNRVHTHTQFLISNDNKTNAK